MSLAQKQSSLPRREVEDHMRTLPQWQLQESSIIREFCFKDFRQALNFVNRVAQIAESEDHHPDILISYNKVKLVLSTHKVGGLTNKDFVLAQRLNQLI